eukprot:CAMPEP_0115601026 /NCGR_PEP_ID=MMETSP0272-20121206/15191_1 /TAXON_ID=71861 /ORGANISM="Scrippsiella trochoidea, Strain CCMP3099" /LENGTH=97 /DNA_ID=CAMNT_0003036487 /DNA_START=166 /DNA_END=459 /DNA_ORIENTATION=-
MRCLQQTIPLRLDEASERLAAHPWLSWLRDVPPDHVRRGVDYAAAQDLRRLPDLETQAVLRCGHGHLLAAPALDHEARAGRGRSGAAPPARAPARAL